MVLVEFQSSRIYQAGDYLWSLDVHLRTPKEKVMIQHQVKPKMNKSKGHIIKQNITHLNGNGVLVVGRSREDLRFFCRNNSISWDKFRHNTSNSFDTQGKWVDIQ